MTARSRFAVLVSATTLAATLALAPVAYAQNAGDGMKKDTMGKTDTMSKARWVRMPWGKTPWASPTA